MHEPEVFAEMPEISVIVPFYNARDTLLRCVESIRHQMGPAVEVVCVDDASTDDGVAKLKQRYAGDARVRVVRQARNEGAGAARNLGLLKARGAYVLFVDADDTLAHGALLRLYTLAREHGSEIVKGTFEMVFDDRPNEVARWASTPDILENTTIFDSPLLQRIPGSHCNYLYQREFLVENELRYPTDLRLGEDLVLIASALVLARRVTLTPQVVYHYHQTPSSLTRQRLLGLAALLSAIKQRQRVAHLLANSGLADASERYLKRWEYQTSTYWMPRAEQRPFSEWQQVFDAFREATSHVGCPWRESTPLTCRYLYALLLLRDDRKAIDLLTSDVLTSGFQSREQQSEAVSLVEGIATRGLPKPRSNV